MRKVLVSLLVAAMVLGLVGTAFAGFSDVASNKYVDKVAAFGWVNGYPDGTFKPAGNITRAEASAVIVRALGLEAAADAAKGLGSKFSDVPGTHWASGYINVCTTKNILKGYPDGTFKPEANVTNAEIVTMIVRALNRESEAIGEWPVGHITVAAAESIIGTGFASSTPATRENVATYVAKAADVKFLKLTSNGWEEDTKTMATQNDLTQLKDVHVSDYDSDENDPSIEIDDNPLTVAAGDAISFFLADGYVVTEGKSLRDLLGVTTDMYLNDDDEIVLVEVKSTSSTKSGTVKSVGADYFYMYDDSRKYEMDVAAKLFRNGEPLGTVAVDFNKILVDDVVEFTMESGEVTYLKATDFDNAHAIVSAVRATGEVSSQYIRVRNSTAATTKRYWIAQDTVVKLNGAVASLSDIDEDYIVSIQVNPNDADVALMIDASNKTVTGAVTAKRTATTDGTAARYIAVDGVEYRVESGAELYDDGAYVAATTAFDGTDIGDTVTVYLSVRGRAKMIDATTGTAAFGKIITTSTGGDYDKWVIDIKGTEVTYEIDDDWTNWSAAATVAPAAGDPTRGFADGDYVRIERDSKGRLTNLTRQVVDKWLDVTNDDVVVLAPAGLPGYEVTEVWRADKQIEVDTNGVLVAGGVVTLTVNDSSIVYVDGEFGSVSSIPEESRIRYILKSDNRTVAFAMVDTACNADKGAIVAQAGRVIEGVEDAVEPGATVEVYASAAAADAAVAGTQLEFDNDLTAVTANTDGEFTLTMDAAGAGLGVLGGGANAGTTVYLRVTDKMGMWAIVSVLLK